MNKITITLEETTHKDVEGKALKMEIIQDMEIIDGWIGSINTPEIPIAMIHECLKAEVKE